MSGVAAAAILVCTPSTLVIHGTERSRDEPYSIGRRDNSSGNGLSMSLCRAKSSEKTTEGHSLSESSGTRVDGLHFPAGGLIWKGCNSRANTISAESAADMSRARACLKPVSGDNVSGRSQVPPG
ncbi:hypothetical protein Bbelb_274750 [Branchiostoma belcheri]|nr:hypothetical protein Bbelb_274750 [Branchiostoma belcheri]